MYASVLIASSCAILDIALYWKSYMCQLGSDLMKPTGIEHDTEDCVIVQSQQHFVFQLYRLEVGCLGFRYSGLQMFLIVDMEMLQQLVL